MSVSVCECVCVVFMFFSYFVYRWVSYRIDPSIVDSQYSVHIYFYWNDGLQSQQLDQVSARTDGAWVQFNHNITSYWVSDIVLYYAVVCYHLTTLDSCYYKTSTQYFSVPSVVVDINSKGPYKVGDVVSFQIDASQLHVSSTTATYYLYQSLPLVTDPEITTGSSFTMFAGNNYQYNITIDSGMESVFGYYVAVYYECVLANNMCVNSQSELFFVPDPQSYQ